ncbi:MAG: MotA/TolQ/ExbB proton channel family protein [Flavobacteriia bacterium]|nr:MotA/TolQ/ExbB proton channel family protein [Flavobacteriia bacterium]
MSFLFTTILNAQNTNAAVGSHVKKAMVNEEISAFDFFIKGGVFLIPIAILLFYTIFVIVERYLYIKKTTKYNANLLKEVKNCMNDGNLEKALTVTSKNHSAFGKIINEGILTVGRPMSEVESNMEKVANIEVGNLEKKIGHLGLISGIAPTLGFIGTISGVIKIFYSISISEDISIGNISGGLYEKMISSGSGLIVGIIAFAGYHLLNGMIDNFTLNAQKSVLEFIQILQRPNGDKTK